MVSDWFQTGSIWFLTGSDWFRTGFRLVQSGFGLVSNWFQSGFRLVSEWFGAGFRSFVVYGSILQRVCSSFVVVYGSNGATLCEFCSIR